jgi:glyoxylase-like metal-dependent hydrolase (beta-lactamase superfamily II)/8-oxo-dGTP pyrophosphatase MutT (NUDIX family)
MSEHVEGIGGSSPRPAATLVIVRDGPTGLEVLLTIRPRHLRFMAGAAVFPGGAVAPADLDERWDRVSVLSARDARSALDIDDERVALAVYVCALRESFEEVGFDLGLSDSPTRREADRPDLWLDWFLDSGTSLPTERLAPAGRWITPAGAPVRFDAWFFLAQAPAGWEPVPDPSEVERCLWITPAAALDQLGRGELAMAPPTIEMVQRLAGYDNADDALRRLQEDRLTGAGRVISVRLSPVVHIVLAPNPSLMTGPGTNSYVVGTGPTFVIDPGVDDEEYLDELAKVAGDVSQILITHRHPDHVGGALALSQRTGAPVRAFGREPAGSAEVVPLSDDEVVGSGGVELRALHTPGHASDHLCFFLPGTPNCLFSGDNILGEGTSVIAPPDGDMGAFLRSLDRIADLDAERIYPGHFRPLDGGRAVIEQLISHRAERGEAILGSLTSGPRTLAEIVEEVYVDTPPALHPVAEMSVLAHLEMFRASDLVEVADGRWRRAGAG